MPKFETDCNMVLDNWLNTSLAGKKEIIENSGTYRPQLSFLKVPVTITKDVVPCLGVTEVLLWHPESP